MLLSEIPWDPFPARDEATLLFVRRAHELLLIRKKRGLGAGKINAPGGRLEPGETPEQAAVREVEEEVGVHPTGARPRGDLKFAFVDGYLLHCHVFAADGCEGEPRETDEALPIWVPLDRIPYGEMWADDALWLPRMLAGWTFSGRFVFDGDRMLEHELHLQDPAEALFVRLRDLGIAHETYEHPPLFTVGQARAGRGRQDGMHVKNLFLRDKKGAMWLVTLPEGAELDLKTLAARLGSKNLSFASAERLRKHLGVEAGSVTPLAAMNDRDGAVTVAVAEEVLRAELMHCHPMTNDRTTTMAGRELERFLEASGHRVRRLQLDLA